MNLANAYNKFAKWAAAFRGDTLDAKMETAVFRHQALPPGPWIRLLQLQPGSRLEPIRCLVFHKTLDDAADEYDALSYVCGPSGPSRLIYVNGKCFAIRKNLFQFLVQLRSEGEAITLWADAICIEQDNVDEKSHQVQQMSSVYRNSRLTRIWLGEGCEHMWKTFQEALLDCDLLRRRQFDRSEYLRAVYEKASKNLKAMISAEYWHRLWIVQEVLLSRNLQIHIGGLTTSSVDFVRFCKDNGGLLSGNAMHMLYQQRQHREGRTLPELIQAHHSTRCTEAKDRVFGLLGLINDFVMDVDYRPCRTRLFEKVLNEYPPQFANVLARPLAFALEIRSDIMAPTPEPSQVVVRAKDCGGLVIRENGFGCDFNRDQVLRFLPYGTDRPIHGDRIISLLSDFDALVSAQACYVLIVRQTQTTEVESHLHGRPKKINYEIIGSATTQHRRSRPGTMPILVEPYVDSIRACRNLESCGYGPILVDMSVEDFLRIEAAGGLPQLLERKEEYNGIVSGREAAKIRLTYSRRDDSDHEENRWGVLV